MSATYDSTLTEDRDQVRFLIRDTTVASALVEDEEIDWVLTEYANVYLAAAAICDTLGGVGTGTNAGVRRMAVAGGPSIEYEPTQYRTLAMALRRKGLLKGLLPFAGGLSVAGKQALTDDSDRVRPAFTRALHSAGLVDPQH